MRLNRLALILTVVALALPACGDDDTPMAADAGRPPDAARLPDAMVPVGDVDDFGPCTDDSDCKEVDSDCRPIVFIGGEKQCIPSCAASTDCPFSTVCYKSSNAQLAFMKDHCWYSLCGEDFMGAAGATGGPCSLGEELGNPVSDQLPGFCLSIDDGRFGQCIEVGAVTEGNPCDFGDQTRDGLNCNGSSICIGMQGNPVGTCAGICNPANILTGTETGCTDVGSPAGQGCYDASNATYYEDAMGAIVMNRQTLGFCTEVTGCATIGPNTCPPDAMSMAQGCAVNNSLRPTGICAPGATGQLAFGAACPADPAADATECAAGSLCIGMSGMEKCTQICDRVAMGVTPVVNCTAPAACTQLLWDGGRDDTVGTPDDTLTADWGACQVAP
ncbi:MAG: hypothetical protein EXR73_03855 [Myxococcales bacterium]|nr:hypothetical protein [Myxococcales bacterium]